MCACCGKIKQDDFPIDSDLMNLPPEAIEKKLGRHVWVRNLTPIYEMTLESASSHAKQYIEALGSHIWVRLVTKQELDLCRPRRSFPDELVTLIIDDEIDGEIDTSEIIALSDSRLTDLFGKRYCCKCINCDTRHAMVRIQRKHIKQRTFISPFIIGSGSGEGFYRETYVCLICHWEQTTEKWQQNQIG